MTDLYINDKLPVFTDKERLKKKLKNLKCRKIEEGLKKIISASIPMIYIENVEELVRNKLYDSKSQIYKLAIREWLIKEYKNLKALRYWK